MCLISEYGGLNAYQISEFRIYYKTLDILKSRGWVHEAEDGAVTITEAGKPLAAKWVKRPL